jgi:hypothetical protein
MSAEAAINFNQPAEQEHSGAPSAVDGGAEKIRTTGRGKGARRGRQPTPPSSESQPPLPIESKKEADSNRLTEASASKVERAAPGSFLELTLKQKLAEVRRRISYVQKRGHNERYNYSYVTAADLAGAVGDALAELEVVVIPQLESISHENIAPNQGYQDRLTRVVMTYTFMDVNSADQLTVKVPGEGRDPGDKGPYKAMTGALKYALLQSFLIATGDDPEDERAEEVRHTGTAADPVISREQLSQVQQLIEDTGTDTAKMLEYFKISRIEEMTTIMYGRAVHALRRKHASGANQDGAHA